MVLGGRTKDIDPPLVPMQMRFLTLINEFGEGYVQHFDTLWSFATWDREPLKSIRVNTPEVMDSTSPMKTLSVVFLTYDDLIPSFILRHWHHRPVSHFLSLAGNSETP